MILLNIMPSLTARKGYKAREVMIEAFDTYFRQGHHERGSVLVQSRYKNSRDNKIPINDIARYTKLAGVSRSSSTQRRPASGFFFTYIHTQKCSRR